MLTKAYLCTRYLHVLYQPISALHVQLFHLHIGLFIVLHEVFRILVWLRYERGTVLLD